MTFDADIDKLRERIVMLETTLNLADIDQLRERIAMLETSHNLGLKIEAGHTESIAKLEEPSGCSKTSLRASGT